MSSWEDRQENTEAMFVNYLFYYSKLQDQAVLGWESCLKTRSPIAALRRSVGALGLWQEGAPKFQGDQSFCDTLRSSWGSWPWLSGLRTPPGTGDDSRQPFHH